MSDPTQVTSPLTIYRGDTYVKTFNMQQLDTATNTYVPVDMRAYGTNWQAQMRQSADADASFTCSVDTSDLINGNVTIRLEAAQTALMPSKGVWDVQAIDTTQTPNYVRTLFYGTFVRTKDVTR